MPGCTSAGRSRARGPSPPARCYWSRPSGATPAARRWLRSRRRNRERRAHHQDPVRQVPVFPLRGRCQQREHRPTGGHAPLRLGPRLPRPGGLLRTVPAEDEARRQVTHGRRTMQNYYDVEKDANRRLKVLFPDLDPRNEVEVRDVEYGGGYHPTSYAPG